MTDRAVLVTGANSGIGAGITRLLSASGYAVLGTYFSHPERADELRSSLRASGGRVAMVQADLADPLYDYHGLVAAAIDELGDLNAVVNCAAEVSTIRFRDVTTDDFDRLICLNLRAPLFISQAAFLAHQAGVCRLTAIVNISSVSDRYVWHGPAYEASKAGLSMITRSIGFELAQAGIRVNAVAPGSVASERSLAEPGWSRELIGEIVPMGRAGEPEDVANVVHFLLSDAAAYLTGQVLYVDGGLSLRL
ncbi:MAG TPA: SDR family oxidoreductase [Herpetosiphonaceae bacterium]